MSCSVSRSSVTLRSQIASLAPSRAKARAMPRPIPSPVPVTIATLSCKRFIRFFQLTPEGFLIRSTSRGRSRAAHRLGYDANPQEYTRRLCQAAHSCSGLSLEPVRGWPWAGTVEHQCHHGKLFGHRIPGQAVPDSCSELKAESDSECPIPSQSVG